MSSSLVIGVPEDQKADSVTDLSSPFGLERIKIEYICLQPGQSHKQTIPARCNHFCYVIAGTGSLLTSDENEDPALLKLDDCFSFPSHVSECRYTVHVSSEKSLSLITFTDVPNPDAIALTTELPITPSIVCAETIMKWHRGGINRKKWGSLTLATDMSLLVPLTKLQKLPWNVLIARFLPGTQSSNAHCHSLEDEFVLVLSGKARYWHQGEAPEKIVKKGDTIGWKAGTGICHSLLNDADGPNGEGEDLVCLIWGENCREIDKLYYAAKNPPWWTDDVRWFERPDIPNGPALASPRNPRPGDEYQQE